MPKIRRALLSVSDKTGLVALAEVLAGADVELISTGGTARALRDAGLKITDLSAHTGFPEMLDGRVKTLHPKVHGGLLFVRANPEHVAAVREHSIEPIDLLVVNLYPFEKTVADPHAKLEDAVENIDIGGPSMLRSGAKNFQSVTVVTDPADYDEVATQIRTTGQTTLDLRRKLAAHVFARTSAYDDAIAAWLAQAFGLNSTASPASGVRDVPPLLTAADEVSRNTISPGRGEGDRASLRSGSVLLDPRPSEALPHSLEIHAPLSQELRYGENPHQRAALYGAFRDYYQQLHGKELSYNNILDLTAAAGLISEFTGQNPTLAILKHTNPCGVGQGVDLREAWTKAFATDKQAPFGGIIAVNKTLDLACAEAIADIFSEVIVAPGYAEDALALLKKKKNLRLITISQNPNEASPLEIRSVGAQSFLMQDRDLKKINPEDCKVVTHRKPSSSEMDAMLFGWRVVKQVKSNAIIYAASDRTLGIGAGQMSRVDSSRIAVWKASEAGLSLQGSAVCSDAFFPFPDGLVAAARAGATAAIQPGGSVRDPEVIGAADENNMAMVFTGIRHFRH